MFILRLAHRLPEEPVLWHGVVDLSDEQELFAGEVNLPTSLILPTLITGELFPLWALTSPTTSKIPSLLLNLGPRAVGNI